MRTMDVKKMNVIKSVFVSLSVMAFVFAGTSSFAKGTISVLPFNDKDHTVISVVTAEEANMSVAIEDVNGDVIYYKEVAGTARDYSKVFDLTKMGDGDFTVIVKTGKDKLKKDFSVVDGVVNVKEKKNTKEPFFHTSGDEFQVSFLNFDEDFTSLAIYNSNNKIVYRKQLGTDTACSYKTDLGYLKAGDYQAVFKAGDDVYTHKFSK